MTFWERSEERLIKGASGKQAVGLLFMVVPITLLAIPLLRGADYLGRSLTPEQWVLIGALLAFCVLLVGRRIVRPPALVLNVDGMSAPGQSRSILWREVGDLRIGRVTWWPFIRGIRMKRTLQGKTSTICIPDAYEMSISELAALLEAWRVRHSGR